MALWLARMCCDEFIREDVTNSYQLLIVIWFSQNEEGLSAVSIGSCDVQLLVLSADYVIIKLGRLHRKC